MLYLATFLWLLFVHWVADFVLQSSWMAQNKSKDTLALLWHVGVYTVVLATGIEIWAWYLLLGPSFKVGLLYVFVLINGILHFCTDFITSRATARLYAKQDWHNFFVVVGFDQLIHQTTLAVSMCLLIDIV